MNTKSSSEMGWKLEGYFTVRIDLKYAETIWKSRTIW